MTDYAAHSHYGEEDDPYMPGGWVTGPRPTYQQPAYAPDHGYQQLAHAGVQGHHSLYSTEQYPTEHDDYDRYGEDDEEEPADEDHQAALGHEYEEGGHLDEHHDPNAVTYPQHHVTGETDPQHPGTGVAYAQHPGMDGTYAQHPGMGGTYAQHPGMDRTAPQHLGIGGTASQHPGTAGTYPQHPGTDPEYPEYPGMDSASYDHVPHGMGLGHANPDPNDDTATEESSLHDTPQLKLDKGKGRMQPKPLPPMGDPLTSTGHPSTSMGAQVPPVPPPSTTPARNPRWQRLDDMSFPNIDQYTNAPPPADPERQPKDYDNVPSTASGYGPTKISKTNGPQFNYPAYASAGGPADKFRNGKAVRPISGLVHFRTVLTLLEYQMVTFKPISDAITTLLTQSYNISGKPKATLAFQKAELEIKKVQTLRMTMEQQCMAADKAFQSSLSQEKGPNTHAMQPQPVQDVSVIMTTMKAFTQPLMNTSKLMKQVIYEMGYVDRYLLFKKDYPVFSKLMEQVFFTGVKLLIPLPHVPWVL